MKIIVTGGAGFIGSAVVRHLIGRTAHEVLVVDKLTYAGNLASLASVQDNSRYRFSRTDICDRRAMVELLRSFDADAIMHLAAESHVDRSIDEPADFITTNVVGTYVLLETALAHWRRRGGRPGDFRFHHVSTDEVFGALADDGSRFTENTRYDPRSPYSATKAASDHLVRAWAHTYGLPAVLSNCSNNYGPHQFVEKLIPLTILKCLAGEPIPVYGRGAHIRDWLFVEDHAEALALVLEKGRAGETYNIGGEAERPNIDVVHAICDAMDRLAPRNGGQTYRALVTFVPDRPGHDFRYAIDCAKVKAELGWAPKNSFDSGLALTVQWYIDNRAWWEPLLRADDATRRRGLAKNLAKKGAK
ncbi:MAG TPA: dTDP-glucose 4,6-dehydratase [Pseudolabrys sp.]|jgi:dTDP-glucose 4,6-dehydratase|nr:dTDP-glucose 4,6-dehydratase [Pseudolabrys sp.]